MLPLMLIFLVLDRYVVRGLTFGSSRADIAIQGEGDRFGPLSPAGKDCVIEFRQDVSCAYPMRLPTSRRALVELPVCINSLAPPRRGFGPDGDRSAAAPAATRSHAS
jgi:hypothetical protein